MIVQTKQVFPHMLTFQATHHGADAANSSGTPCIPWQSLHSSLPMDFPLRFLKELLDPKANVLITFLFLLHL